MKKLFLVFVFLAGVLSAKDVPLRVKFQTSDKYPSIEITSLYDGIITIDHAKIVANKGRCKPMDTSKFLMDVFSTLGPVQNKYGIVVGPNKKIASPSDSPDTSISKLDYGESAKVTFSNCDQILEVKIPTNVGTFTFK
ncbi:MAG: hypothetical protein ACTTJF_04145 [Campylobacter sp.]|mgnify:CR=1 FL=1|uniref:hypothetical protein n=1 Tax=Campylobacter sp. TaxID=205 RepID=UPI0026328CAB|nr:hypothetical protein [uncultured Campylobacter sp.]